MLFIVGCNSHADEKEERDQRKDDMLSEINDDIDNILALDSLSVVWDIESQLIYDEDVEDSDLFSFTDRYLTDEEEFESLNDKEQTLVMKTSGMISKYKRDEYDEDKLKEDVKEYREVLQTGEWD